MYNNTIEVVIPNNLILVILFLNAPIRIIMCIKSSKLIFVPIDASMKVSMYLKLINYGLINNILLMFKTYEKSTYNY